MDDTIDLQQDQDAETNEETLSLSEFPQTTSKSNREEEFPMFHDPRSSSEPTEYFEFFSDLTNPDNIMSHAEDIIFCGKLIPFKEPVSSQTHHHKLQNFHRKRSESMSELKSTSLSNSTTDSRHIMRTSRSLDYKKLNRNSSLFSETPSGIYQNGSGKFDVWGFKVPKPRWGVLMFGLVKFPPEMDLRDIKSRQVRRSSSRTLFHPFDDGKIVPVSQNERKNTWGLLKVLSCRASASVAVTASFGCLPKA